jgi:flagellin
VTVAAAGSTSAASVQSTGTITPTNATDLISGTIAVSLSGGTANNFSVTGLTASQFTAAFNANTTFSSQGITATVNTGTGVITIKGPVSGIGGSVTFTSNLTSTTAAGVTDAAPVAASGTAAVDGRSLESIVLSTLPTTVAGTLTIGVGTGAQTSITVNAGTTGSQLAAQINANTTFQNANIVASYSSTTGTLSIYGPAGTGSTLNFTGSALTQTTKATPGAGVNFTDQSINTLTASNASAVLTSLTSAIADVAYQRGILGANINQLNAAAGVANTANVNLTSASNAIQATNYGQATSDLAKYEVLSQTGISALAQANTVQQEILKLLQ